jgi:hypothetical protein
MIMRRRWQTAILLHPAFFASRHHVRWPRNRIPSASHHLSSSLSGEAMAKTRSKRGRYTAVKLKTKSRELPPPVKTPWTKRVYRWYLRLNRRSKRLIAICTTIAFVWGVYATNRPQIQILRETENGTNPPSADFMFKNTGRLPTMKILISCNTGTGLRLDSGDTKVELSRFRTRIPPYKRLDGGASIVRGCGIDSPDSIPAGGITIAVDYQFPLIPFIKLHDEQYFTFRYDSAARGYIFVPDIEN